MKNESILSVKDLSVSFHMYEKGLEQYDLKVISNMTLDVRPGEIVAIAGSSGSGKSLLAHAVMGLLPENAAISGEISYKGKVLSQKDKEKLRGKEFALVPQSVSFLDPLIKVEAQVRGPKPDMAKIEAQKEIFKRFQLDEKTEKLYPFQLSGGMARRVLVSTAVLSGAEVIIADEPTPGLDLDMAMEALKVFRELADEGKAVILITHDIDWPFIWQTALPCFMREPRWKWQRQRISDRVSMRFAIPIPKPCGEHCPRMDLNPFPVSSPMRNIFPRAVCFRPDVRIRQRNVKKKYL